MPERGFLGTVQGCTEVREGVVRGPIRSSAKLETLAEPALELVGSAQPDLDGPVGIEAPIQDMEPPTVTQADLDAAPADAESVTFGDVVFEPPLRTDLGDLVLEPTDLVRILTFETDEDAPEGERFQLCADADALDSVLGDDGSIPSAANPKRHSSGSSTTRWRSTAGAPASSRTPRSWGSSNRCRSSRPRWCRDSRATPTWRWRRTTSTVR